MQAKLNFSLGDLLSAASTPPAVQKPTPTGALRRRKSRLLLRVLITRHPFRNAISRELNGHHVLPHFRHEASYHAKIAATSGEEISERSSTDGGRSTRSGEPASFKVS